VRPALVTTQLAAHVTPALVTAQDGLPGLPTQISPALLRKQPEPGVDGGVPVVDGVVVVDAAVVAVLRVDAPVVVLAAVVRVDAAVVLVAIGVAPWWTPAPGWAASAGDATNPNASTAARTAPNPPLISFLLLIFAPSRVDAAQRSG
jgi:hypothetical protein